jgi:type II secretory pathway pseudopilin PulG
MERRKGPPEFPLVGPGSNLSHRKGNSEINRSTLNANGLEQTSKQICPLGSHPPADQGLISGFSLIELLIASLIFITGGLCIISLLVYSVSMNQQARLESAALHLSEQKMEELKATSFSDSRLTSPGCPLDGNAEIDYLGSADALHSSQRQLPLEISRSSFINYDTRWHVEDSAGKKMITLATSPIPSPFPKLRPVNLRLLRTP